MPRERHPNKEIEQALQFAELKGWRYFKAGSPSHSWGRMFCGKKDRDGCIMSIWSTPKSSEGHAKQIRRNVNKCQCLKDKK